MFGRTQENKDNYIEPELKEPYFNWLRNKTPQNASILLQKLNPILTAAIRTYANNNQSPVIVSQTKRLILENLENYDPTKSSLKTHLMTRLQRLRRLNAQANQIVHIPERVAILQGQIKNVYDQFILEQGREPSDTELADRIGISPKQLARIRQYNMSPLSESITVMDSDEGPTQAEPAIESSDDSVWKEFVYQDLNPKDQIIMEHIFGMHNKPKLQKSQIAQKMGVSSALITQRVKHIQDKLNLKQDLDLNFF